MQVWGDHRLWMSAAYPWEPRLSSATTCTRGPLDIHPKTGDACRMGYGDIDGDRPAALELDRIDAVLFDLDGVITDTASLHAAAWKQVFDDVLRAWAEREGVEQQPFDTDEDYRRYFDGRPRLDGAEAFLSSRGISLPRGEPDDSRDRETAWGIGHPAPVARAAARMARSRS